MPIPEASLLARLAAHTAFAGLDADLLARFSACRDEVAFVEIVRRHGAAVYRVCRRLAGPDAADDAFQATFLVLATRAGSVRQADSVGSWLIGVAGRVARQMRAASLRRRRHEHSCGQIPRRPEAEPETAEQFRILDEELTLLPDRLRGPVVACLLLGRSQEQAAAELGGSPRTIRRRLDEGKRLLRLRLERRGVIPAVATALAVGAGEVAVAVPPDLGSRTVAVVFDFLAGGAARTAAPALIAQGVVTTMTTRKPAVFLVAAALGLAALGVGMAGSNPGDGPVPKTTEPLKAALPPLVPAAPPKVAIAHPPGFTVTGASPSVARALVNELTFQRRLMADKWGGGMVPAEPEHTIPVEYHEDGKATHGPAWLNVHADEKGWYRPDRLTLSGPLAGVLESDVPQVMVRAVFIERFKANLPPWALTGVPALEAPAAEQRSLDTAARRLVTGGKAVRMGAFLAGADAFSEDVKVQGHSVARFLLTQKAELRVALFEGGSIGRLGDDEVAKLSSLPNFSASRHGLATFLSFGGNWSLAAKEVYGFRNADDLEAAWIAWLRTPASTADLPPGAAPRAVPPPPPPRLIPPVNLDPGQASGPRSGGNN